MLKNTNPLNLLFWNIALAACWHVVVFIACVHLPVRFFDSQRKRYQPRRWEKGGRWYRDYLKIHLWKDKVPQFIAKDGFSKSHITSLSLEYLNEFVMETCRGEWMHFANCLCAVVVLLINPFPVNVIFAIMILLGNLPFALIQRYNRFRLNTLRRKLIRDMQHVSQAAEQEKATVST